MTNSTNSGAPGVSSFKPREKRLIAELAHRYVEAGQNVVPFEADTLKSEEGEIKAVLLLMLRKLEALGLVESISESGNHWLMSVQIQLIHEQLAIQPKRNYFNELNEWWFSKKWATVLVLATVLLPLIVQWVEMLHKIVK